MFALREPEEQHVPKQGASHARHKVVPAAESQKVEGRSKASALQTVGGGSWDESGNIHI